MLVMYGYMKILLESCTNNLFNFMVRKTLHQGAEGERESGWDRVKALFDLRFVL